MSFCNRQVRQLLTIIANGEFFALQVYLISRDRYLFIMLPGREDLIRYMGIKWQYFPKQNLCSLALISIGKRATFSFSFSFSFGCRHTGRVWALRLVSGGKLYGILYDIHNLGLHKPNATKRKALCVWPAANPCFALCIPLFIASPFFPATKL